MSCWVLVESVEHRRLEGTARLPPAQGRAAVLGLAQLGLRHCSVPQVVLIISGNLSFLNWLTIVPSIACFDDATLGFLFPSGPGSLKDRVLKMQKEEAQEARPTPTYGGWTPGDVDRGLYSRPRIAGPQRCWPILTERLQALPIRAVMTQFPHQPQKVSLAGGDGSCGQRPFPDSQAGGQQHHPQLL